MKPSSFCCLSTYGCHQELFGLLLSLSIHHPNSNVYCLVDTKQTINIIIYTKTKTKSKMGRKSKINIQV